ncbi:MAG TPA: toll/interleukin-1 receptor domain-containing protein, partial [Vicinamibacterales bacterium]
MTDTGESAPNAASQGHTFVCYARHDEVFVLRIATAMRDRGVRIWIDQWRIQPGADWSRSIDEALKT